MKKNVGTPNLLQLLLGLLLIPVATAYTLVTDDTYKWLTETIGYKLLWTILIFLLLSLIYTIIYFRFNFKTDLVEAIEIKNNPQESKAISIKQDESENNKSLIENLSPPEKEKLLMFLKENRKVIWTKYDSDIKILCRNRILKCLTYNPSSPSEIMIEEWVWEWINKNKEKLS